MIDILDSFKSNELADEYRNAGNKFYCERNFFDALLKYNQSLCFAITDSEAIGLAYANRSAVYFEMKLFEKCKGNIKLAITHRYPKKNLHILEKRSQKCEELMKNNEDQIKLLENPFEFVKLSYKANPHLPFVVDCLELKESETYGRYIVADQDFKVGDILAIEDPYFKVMKSDSRYDSCDEFNKYQRCAVCLNDNCLMDLIPCATCSSTMYCSQICKNYAETHFHNYECAIIEILMKTGIMQMAMRVFFQSLNIFDGSIDVLKRFLDESKKTSVYDFDFSKIDEKSHAKNYLLSTYHLARNDYIPQKESPEKLFMLHPTLAEMWEQNSEFIVNFISRILRIGDSNFHGVCGWSIQKCKNYEPQMIGIACYPFISLINHACLPNVNRIYAEGKMFLLVERPIIKGEQLFDCYRTTFFTQPKRERQMILFQNYSFQCQCEACVKNYPLFHALKSLDKKLLKYAKKCKNDVQKLESSDEAKKKFTECCEIIQERYSKGYPSSEIILLQECLQQCLAVIIKPKILFS